MTKFVRSCRPGQQDRPSDAGKWVYWYRRKGETAWRASTEEPSWLSPYDHDLVVTHGPPPTLEEATPTIEAQPKCDPPRESAPTRKPSPTPAPSEREASVLIPANSPVMSAKRWEKRRRRDFDALMRASREQQGRQRASDEQERRRIEALQHVRNLTDAIVETSRQVPMSEWAKIDRELEKLRGRRK